MWQIFIGSLVLSIVHALIPNHWIPLIAISKTEKWTNRESVLATLTVGFFHTMSSIIIGIIVGFVGIKLSESYSEITKIIASSILVFIGIIYLLISIKSHHHHHHFDDKALENKKSKFAIIAFLSLAMFFSPCIEIEAFYFQAATIGWGGVILLSLVYLIVTPVVMSTLVLLGLKGIDKFNWHFLEHYQKTITGIILIIMGLLAYFVEF